MMRFVTTLRVQWLSRLLAASVLTLVARTAISAPNDPAQSFTPGLGGPLLQARADEAGQFGVSEQTGSPSYRYHFTVPPAGSRLSPTSPWSTARVRVKWPKGGHSTYLASIALPAKAFLTLTRVHFYHM